MEQDIKELVKSKYGAVATSGLSTENDGVKAVAQAFGYSADELASIPAEANMGLSCGNPIAAASLRPGEVVVDLGCGGGLDVLLAAQRVGPTGKAIGIDVTPEMIELARKNSAKSTSPENTEFYLAPIDDMPLADSTADCVISNCVINLAPDKSAVFREVLRILKPGGRLAVSDIALKRPLPDGLANDIAAYVGCIAGAISMDDYRRLLREAGFSAVEIVDSGADLNAYANMENQSGCCSAPAQPSGGLAIIDTGCCSSTPSTSESTLHSQLGDLFKQYDVNEYAASVKVFAVKP